MSRIRTIKPDFFRSASLARCSPLARLTFAGLWCEADDRGRGKADPRILKGALWALDDGVSAHDVADHLKELESTDHIVVYEVDGDTYFAVLNWDDHQAAAYRRAEAKYPAPPQLEHVQPARVDVLEGNGREGNMDGKAVDVQRGTSASPDGKHRGSTVPKEFPITDQMRSWAKDAGIRCDLKRETYKFLDHFKAKGEPKKDWVAAWRNWMRKADEYAGNGQPNHTDTSRPAKGAGEMFSSEEEREAFYREHSLGKVEL